MTEIHDKPGAKPPPAGYRDLPLTLPSLEIATLRVPVPMTEEDFQMLLTVLGAMKKNLLALPSDKTTTE